MPGLGSSAARDKKSSRLQVIKNKRCSRAYSNLTLRRRLREEAKPDAVRSPHDLLDVALGQLLRARHGRGRTSQFGAHLPRNQGIYLRAVVLVVRQALVNLSPR
jgi:hypothetical protein